MSSLIEQAAKRLEQLRGAGVAVPVPEPSPSPVASTRTAGAAPGHPATDEVAREVELASSSRRVELNMAMLESSGIVTPNAPRSRIADEFRVIKRPLISNAIGRGAQALTHGNLIMVTSAMPGEGKSFTALNLAMSIAAELDHTVMLVDADVARPSILRMLGLPNGPGLLDVLGGQAEMADVMMKTNIDKLSILPSGTPHSGATELLASDAMRLLLDDISKRYPDRIVIFGSPPLLLTTEARVLATQMGQVVLVVQAEKSLQADVQHALSTIESCPVKMMLLNRMRTDPKGSYGYGYGYGYGSEKQAA